MLRTTAPTPPPPPPPSSYAMNEPPLEPQQEPSQERGLGVPPQRETCAKVWGAGADPGEEAAGDTEDGERPDETMRATDVGDGLVPGSDTVSALRGPGRWGVGVGWGEWVLPSGLQQLWPGTIGREEATPAGPSSVSQRRSQNFLVGPQASLPTSSHLPQQAPSGTLAQLSSSLGSRCLR